MTTVLFTIETPYGNRYRIHTGGMIERTDMPFTPSDSWRLLGIRHVTRRESYSLNEITPELVGSLPWTYKNGNPQYTVVDLDHGTRRVWGNTKHHGIRRIYFD
jgi:hypothetical protein